MLSEIDDRGHGNSSVSIRDNWEKECPARELISRVIT